jgi:hypothetical protein
MAGQALPYSQAMTYIACDVPDGMRLATWRKAAGVQRRRRRKLKTLRRALA